MFIGHFGLSFAAKPVAPRAGLSALFTAAAFADVLWPLFLALGIEQVRIDPGNTRVTPLDFVSYPYSHSLLTLVVWGLVFALAYRAITGVNGRAAIVLAALVVSHWVLDWITHRPDMPLYPGGPVYGLGLWNSFAATVAVEVPLFAIGVWIYARSTRPADRVGKWAFAGLIALLVISYVANFLAGPPPSLTGLIAGALAGTLILLAFARWVDRHRTIQAH